MSQPSRLSRHILLLLTGLLLYGGVLAAAPTEVTLELDGRRMVLPGVEEEGRTYVSVKAVAALLEGQLSGDAESGFRLETPGGTAVFPAEVPSLVQVKGAVVSLSAQALIQSGDLYVPADSAERVFTPLLQRAEPAPEVPEGAVPATVGLTGTATELRLILEAPADLSPSLSDRGENLMVRFGKGVRLAPPYASRTLGGSLLQEIVFEQKAGGTLMRLVTGPGFRSATLEPHRGGGRVEVVLRGEQPSRTVPRLGESELRVAGVRRVVIDPGHGGAEEGARGPDGLLEKDITLQVSRRLQKELEARGFEVSLTRTVDRDLGLDDRAAIANHQRADLFISLHANASPRKSARGAETYFLAREATDDAARTLAALENDATRRGARDEPEGLELVLWDLAQVEYLEESAALAETVQHELNLALGLTDRGVRQAPFRVLMGATMPAVLIEMGFLTHEDEGRLLGNAEHQDRLAQAIARAVDTFRLSYGRRLGVEGQDGGGGR
jgi:N-acetylmuramoyl-L-alanine amidase